MIKMKKNDPSGITLVALIITIVVLIILTSVLVNEIGKNNSIEKAQNAANQYEISKEIGKLQEEVTNWAYDDTDSYTLQGYFAEIYGSGNSVQPNANDKSVVIVTVQSGNKYKVTKNGEVTSYEM